MAYLGKQLSSVSAPTCALLSHVSSKTTKLLHCEDLFPLIEITCHCDSLNDIPTLSRIFEYLAPVGGTVWGALGEVRSKKCVTVGGRGGLCEFKDSCCF